MSQLDCLLERMGELRTIIEFNESAHPVGTAPMQVPMQLAKELLACVDLLAHENNKKRL